MRCENISEYLSAYVENDLEPGLRLNVDQHLETCEGCRADLAAIGELYGALDAPAMMVEVPGNLADNVMRRLRVEQRETRRSARGWFASLSRTRQFATAGAGTAVILLVVFALGPFHEGVTGGLAARFPWKASAPAAAVRPNVTIAATVGGFRTAGVPDDLLLDISVPRAGRWRVTVRTSPGISVPSNATLEPDGGVLVWEGDLAAGAKQRVTIRLQPTAQPAVHEAAIRLVGPNFADVAMVSVLVPVQTAPAPGSPLQWRTTEATTLRQALATLAAHRGVPIAAPADTLDQPVKVNASGINADDMVDAVAAAAAMKAERSEGACNLHR